MEDTKNFQLKHLLIIKDQDKIANVVFRDTFITREETKIINNFDYKLFLSQQMSINSKDFSNDNISNEKNYNRNIKNNLDKKDSKTSSENFQINLNKKISTKNIRIDNNLSISNSEFPMIKNNFENLDLNLDKKINNNLIIDIDDNNINKSRNQLNDNDISNDMKNSKKKNFEFFSVQINKMKIVVLKKNKVILVSFFSSLTKTCIIKNYLFHMYTVYKNFFHDSFELADKRFNEDLSDLIKEFKIHSKYCKSIKTKESNYYNNLYKNLLIKNLLPLREKDLYDSEKKYFMDLMKKIFFEVIY